jgi:hypothetical protein
MRLLMSGALVILLGAGAAYGQQSQSHTGGTCTGYGEACMRACANNAKCSSECGPKQAQCMQTGIYQGRYITYTDVTRQ